MIVVDFNVDVIVVKEVRSKGVKFIGILDLNLNFDVVDFGIFVNDDLVKSIILIMIILVDVIVIVCGGKVKFVY